MAQWQSNHLACPGLQWERKMGIKLFRFKQNLREPPTIYKPLKTVLDIPTHLNLNYPGEKLFVLTAKETKAQRKKLSGSIPSHRASWSWFRDDLSDPETFQKDTLYVCHVFAFRAAPGSENTWEPCSPSLRAHTVQHNSQALTSQGNCQGARGRKLPRKQNRSQRRTEAWGHRRHHRKWLSLSAA